MPLGNCNSPNRTQSRGYGRIILRPDCIFAAIEYRKRGIQSFLSALYPSIMTSSVCIHCASGYFGFSENDYLLNFPIILCIGGFLVFNRIHIQTASSCLSLFPPPVASYSAMNSRFVKREGSFRNAYSGLRSFFRIVARTLRMFRPVWLHKTKLTRRCLYGVLTLQENNLIFTAYRSVMNRIRKSPENTVEEMQTR